MDMAPDLFLTFDSHYILSVLRCYVEKYQVRTLLF